MAASRCSGDPGSNGSAVPCRWPVASPGGCSPTSAWSTRRLGTTWRRCCSRRRRPPGRPALVAAPGPPGPDRPGRGGRASRPPVDVARVLSGDVWADEAGRLRSGELLAGLAFDDEPGFDNWLLLQRSRVGAAVAETHAWAASALAHTDPEAALDLIGLATRADPFNDSLHELAVELHMTRGDRPTAEAWVRQVTGLYRRDLGAPPPDRRRARGGRPSGDPAPAGAATSPLCGPYR